jgi:hypothetical protein
MISVLSNTDKYILQPTLMNKHRKTMEWLSATLLWKRELSFFQKLLDQYAPKFTQEDDKKKIDHFQNIIIYYNAELLGSLSTKLRLHEKELAQLLESKDESRTQYFKEHDALMNELESFQQQLLQYKDELFQFIEKVMV